MTLVLALFLLLLFLSVIDISSIFGGYFPSDYYFYWINDLNSGVIPMFSEDLSIFHDRSIETLRNLILTILGLAASMTVSSMFGLGYFMKRRFMASQWPLALWKLSTFLLGFRFICVTWIFHKFHYTLLRNILMELEGVEDKDEYEFSVMQLYGNGTIGIIPAGLLVSLALNFAVLLVSMLLIVKTEEWRRLNIKKRVY